MKKIREKIAFFLLMLVVMFVAVPNTVNAMPYTRGSHIKNAVSDYEESKSYDYVIDSYDINIKVNENNTFDITEKLEVYFNEKRHGIYRSIPLSNTVTRLDGTTSKNRAVVSDLEVSDNYTTSREGNNLKIQIGSEDKLVSEKQTYTIRYNYNIGKDPCENIDELYLNIIGDEWDTMIGNITFTIKMPKKFDETKLGFSAGKTGSTESSDVWYYVDGKEIIGEYMGELNPKEALTVRCELPEGYFVNAGLPVNITTYLIFIIPVACLLITLIMWFLLGRDNPVTETVEFYPPEGFNSLELGYLYKGKADSKDVVSLLVYLANKGYIGISQTEEQALFGGTAKSFAFTKEREYDGNDPNEKMFLNGLFRGGIFSDLTSGTNNSGKKMTYSFGIDTKFTSDQPKDCVTKLDLHNNFYKTINAILKNINTKANQNKIFESSSKIATIIAAVMTILCTLLMFGLPTFEYAGLSMAISNCVLVLFFVPFYASFLKSGRSMGSRLFGLGFITVVLALFVSKLPIVDILKSDPIYLAGFFVSIVCIIGMILGYKVMSKRTKYGNEILGKIKGFKTFLETAEKEKLEALVMENPTYFYDILPYTYVLGVSDKWMRQFETISLQAPDWYHSRDHFSVNSFGTFMNDTMKSAQSAMTSSPSSSSGGSGGGSSGGGSGGGGGGSW